MKKGLVCLLIVLMSSCGGRFTGLSGVVIDQGGTPVSGAVVRVQTTEVKTLSDEDGQFILTDLPLGEEFFVTAWSPGFFIVGAEARPGDKKIVIELHPHAAEDNPDYAWLPSEFHPGAGEDQGCAACHSNVGTEDITLLPVDEWLLDVHSQSALNPRFITMYNGTDVNGNQSPSTRFGTSQDYGSFPLPPDLSKPYFGPGYKLDFPNTDGNCAACHTPAASVNEPYSIDPTKVTGVAAEGVPCDFCHKIWDVKLDPITQMPRPNMPGVLSYEFRRPPEGHQFFAGPLDDVAPGEDTFSPIQQESAYCAPCHQAVFWDTVIYNSYGEWLESDYSDEETGQTCQDCHMPSGLADHFALAEEGGLVRDPKTISSHKMLGVMDTEFMQEAVTMTTKADLSGEEINLEVEIFNDNTGHHIPTDSPLRHMILWVQVSDSLGNQLEQLDGPTIPDWGGIGKPSQGYYAGLPGTIYAKVLQELWSEKTPTGAYWNPTRVLSDNRIPALETDSTSYRFSAPKEGPATLEVVLVFRRAFIELIEEKGWDVPDIIISQQIIVLK